MSAELLAQSIVAAAYLGADALLHRSIGITGFETWIIGVSLQQTLPQPTKMGIMVGVASTCDQERGHDEEY